MPLLKFLSRMIRDDRLLLALAATLVFATPVYAQGVTLRVGHFPNVTHVQALVAHNLSRQGQRLVRGTPRR